MFLLYVNPCGYTCIFNHVFVLVFSAVFVCTSAEQGVRGQWNLYPADTGDKVASYVVQAVAQLTVGSEMTHSEIPTLR